MRAKTLGIFLLIGFALFTAVYWLTDPTRRDTAFETQTRGAAGVRARAVRRRQRPEIPVTANCANCHGEDGTGGEVGDQRRCPRARTCTARQSIFEKLKVNPPTTSTWSSASAAWSCPARRLADAGLEQRGRRAADHPAGRRPDRAGRELGRGGRRSSRSRRCPNTVEAGQQVYNDAGCAGCHGGGPGRQPGVFPSLQNIGNEPVTDLPTPISQLDKLEADYADDPRNMLELWIRDSAVNYNDGTADRHAGPSGGQAQRQRACRR